jgi:hypothetical protein
MFAGPDGGFKRMVVFVLDKRGMIISRDGHTPRGALQKDVLPGNFPREDIEGGLDAKHAVFDITMIIQMASSIAQHRSLLHFVGIAPWSDEQVLAKVREMVLPAIERHGPIEAWIIDDRFS